MRIKVRLSIDRRYVFLYIQPCNSIWELRRALIVASNVTFAGDKFSSCPKKGSFSDQLQYLFSNPIFFQDDDPES
jgi:hypothetical protein